MYKWEIVQAKAVALTGSLCTLKHLQLNDIQTSLPSKNHTPLNNRFEIRIQCNYRCHKIVVNFCVHLKQTTLNLFMKIRFNFFYYERFRVLTYWEIQIASLFNYFKSIETEGSQSTYYIIQKYDNDVTPSWSKVVLPDHIQEVDHAINPRDSSAI